MRLGLRAGSFTVLALALAGTLHPGPSTTIPDDMLPVPGGTFTMGADGVGERDEQPAHRVTVQGFLLDKTEVTNGKYLECVAAGACKAYRNNVARGFGAGPEE